MLVYFTMLHPVLCHGTTLGAFAIGGFVGLAFPVEMINWNLPRLPEAREPCLKPNGYLPSCLNYRSPQKVGTSIKGEKL